MSLDSYPEVKCGMEASGINGRSAVIHESSPSSEMQVYRFPFMTLPFGQVFWEVTEHSIISLTAW